MAKFGIQVRKEPSEFGLWIITESGWCTEDEADGIETGCTLRYRLEPLPNAAGAIMKVLDGTNPTPVDVTPATYDRTYSCVKVFGQVEPLTPVQENGPYDGYAILQYTIRWQQVGGIH